MYHHRIWYFLVTGVKKDEERGVHVSKERGDIKKGEGEKRRGGADTPFRTMLFT